MEVVTYTDPVEFRKHADPLLLAEEAKHSLLIGVSGLLVTHPEYYDDFLLWCVVDDERPVLVAAQTPPRNLILSDSLDDGAILELIDLFVRTEVPIPGLVGAEPTASLFAGTYAERTGGGSHRLMAQGIFELRAVDHHGTAPGAWRRATHDDLDLLEDWVAAFVAEVIPDQPGGEEETDRVNIESRLDAEPDVAGFWFWEHRGQPVSLSGYGRPTPNGMSIGPVYTPPDLRGRGFATSLVAAQTQWLLDSGRQMCFLYTDLANPTSNSIYQRIGYRQVAESAEYAFIT